MWPLIVAVLTLVSWLAQIAFNRMTLRRLQSHDVLIAKQRAILSIAIKKWPGFSPELIYDAEDLIREHIPEATTKWSR
jgi:hypothetical protein